MDGFEQALRENLTEHRRLQRLQQSELVRLVDGGDWHTATAKEEDVLRLFRQNKTRADRILWLEALLTTGEANNTRKTHTVPPPSAPVTREKGPAW